MAKKMDSPIPIALQLDHGDSFELAKDFIESGFSSVMLHGSQHCFYQNFRLTRQVVDFAHERDVTIEGELWFWPVSKMRCHPQRPSTPTLRK